MAPGYTAQVVLRWGDPILRGGRAFRAGGFTPEDQARAFGYNNDYLTLLPLPQGGPMRQRILLVANHEYTNPELMFPGYTPGRPSREEVEVELLAHGMSVVELRRLGDGRVEYLPVSPYNRRITAYTRMEIRGPAAGHPLLQTREDPTGRWVLGTLNNCAGGITPWGTVLSGEENFHQYFANLEGVKDPALREAHARYGLPKGATERRWEAYHERFDLSLEPHEPFRFGWVVEVDPYDPTSVPKKRTALGRFKHEGAEVALARDGRVVVYMGDDERFEYLYKFVSKRPYTPGNRAANLDLLDEGTLYVARFHPDGTGEWLPLVYGHGPLTEANGFRSQADVLIHTRRAADLLGATRMDRPEDVERNPVTGLVYAVMTNNSRRTPEQVDRANPRAANKDGHILEIYEEGNDPAATRFFYALFLVCGDPKDPSTYFAGFPKEEVSPIATPDNITFDRQGNLWIATDGMDGSSVAANDGVFAVPTQGPERGRVRQFLSAPRGAEVCGPSFTEDGHLFFAAIQHPGEGGRWDQPLSTWPDGQNPPRPAVVAVRHEEGKPIGS